MLESPPHIPARDAACGPATTILRKTASAESGVLHGQTMFALYRRARADCKQARPFGASRAVLPTEIRGAKNSPFVSPSNRPPPVLRRATKEDEGTADAVRSERTREPKVRR